MGNEQLRISSAPHCSYLRYMVHSNRKMRTSPGYVRDVQGYVQSVMGSVTLIKEKSKLSNTIPAGQEASLHVRIIPCTAKVIPVSLQGPLPHWGSTKGPAPLGISARVRAQHRKVPISARTLTLQMRKISGDVQDYTLQHIFRILLI